MRTAIGVVLALLVAATPALAQAQSTPTTSDSHKVLKVVIGAGILALGATVAATSWQTTTVSSAAGMSQTSTSSTSQLLTGVVIAGAGGFVLWDALRDHRPSQPSVGFGVAAGRQSGGVFVRKAW